MKIHTNKNSSRRLSATIIAFAMVCIMISPIISAATFDNTKGDLILGDGISKYGKVEIRDWFGLLKLTDLELKVNTDTCLINCYAEKEIVMHQDGVLIDSIRFETILDKQRLIEPIREYQFYIQTSAEEIIVNDYETQCEGDLNSCKNIKISSHTEIIPTWKEYNLGEEVSAGIYYVKLEGKKDIEKTVDWIIQSQGIWIDDWAVWGPAYEVNLISAWSMEDVGATMVDVFGPHDGVNRGTITTRIPAINNYGFLFPDDNSNVTVLNSGTFDGGNVTIAIWVNSTVIRGGNDIVFSKGMFAGGGGPAGSLSLLTVANDKYCCIGTDDAGADFTATSTTGDTAGIWVHYACVVNQTDKKVRIYRNGVLEGTSPAAGGAVSLGGKGNITLGTNALNGANNWPGEMDEFYWYNETKTDTFISNLYDAGAGTFFIPFASTLVDPVDGFNSSRTTHSFNCTASESTGRTIENITLWTDQSGTFEIIDESTGLTNQNEGANFTNTISTDGNYLWNCRACNNLGQCVFDLNNNTITIDTTAPSITFFTDIFDYHIIGTNLTMNWTVNDSRLQTCWYNYQDGNITVPCMNNGTTFNVTIYSNRSLIFYVNDSVGNLNTTIYTWNYKVFEESQVFNFTTYETATESYLALFNTSIIISSARLILGSTSTIGTIGINQTSITKTVPLITTPGLIDFYWNLTLTDGTNLKTNNRTQNRSNIWLNACNTTLTVPYINFTFKNETGAQEDIQAFISTSIWNYYMGDGSITKSFSYSNITERDEYAFCFSPNGTKIKTDVSLSYDNSESQQRIYSPSIISLSNVTTNTTLFLLPTSDGIFVTFQVVNNAEQPIEDALVTLTRSGVGTISQTFTGLSGTTTVFLNPDFSYTITIVKSGFPTFTATQTFPLTEYTISLGTSTDGTVQQDYLEGIRFKIRPRAQILINHTDYEFNFTINSSFWSLDEFGYNILNKSGFIFASNSSNENAGGILSSIVNTGNETLIQMNYYWTINSTTQNGTLAWGVYVPGDGSFKGFFDRLRVYIGDRIFGITNFGFAMILFISLFLIVGVLSFKFGLNSPEGIMVAALFTVALFDIGFGMIPSPFERSIPFFPTIITFLILMAIWIRRNN